MAQSCSASGNLESLIETEDIGLEIFHPGGLDMTRSLASLCHIGEGTLVLDVASGTGESACFLAARLGARVIGVDKSDSLLQRARNKAAKNNADVEFTKGDARHLNFPDDTFDAVISECTLCLLDKQQVLAEMVRVVKPGGYVGIHDVCWNAGTPDRLKARLLELEGESPETLGGWQALFDQAGLIDVRTAAQSSALADWTKSIKKTLGLTGQLKVFWRAVRAWGPSGLVRIMASERIFRSRFMGYGIIVGTKPRSAPR